MGVADGEGCHVAGAQHRQNAEQGEVEMQLPECQGCAVVLYGGLVASWHQAVPAPRLEGASSQCWPSITYGLAGGSPVEERAGGGGVGAA